MGAIEKLIGSDGKLVTVDFGTEVIGDGTQTLDELSGGDPDSGAGEGWWEITQISNDATAFDSNLVVGDLFWDDGSLVPDDGTTEEGEPDKARLLDETEKADVSQFGIEINKAEIDVTTLSDDVKRYRAGKTDMTGSLEGITMLGETDDAGGVINTFIRILEQASAGTVTVKEIDDSPLYIKGVIQKNVSAGEKEAFIWAKVNLTSTSLGAGGEEAQNFSSNFRIAPGNPEPTLNVREIAEAS